MFDGNEVILSTRSAYSTHLDTLDRNAHVEDTDYSVDVRGRTILKLYVI